MPRIVDHEQRRQQVARAFRSHVAEHGLAATTFARVAATARVSVGHVQHYFASRDDLLRFVYADCLARIDARLEGVITAAEADRQPIRAILDEALRHLLPLDAERTEEMRVALCLQVQALHDEGLAAVAAAAERDRHRRLAAAVTNGKACGEVEVDVDPELAASRILATVHGLGVRMAHDAGAQSEVDAVLQPVLATVFTGRCRHWDAARG